MIIEIKFKNDKINEKGIYNCYNGNKLINIFENYVYKKSLKGYNILYCNSNATSYVPIGYWYLVIATDTGKKFEDTILIYNKNEYYVLSEDIFNFNYTL
jgi:hypothetical protein